MQNSINSINSMNSIKVAAIQHSSKESRELNLKHINEQIRLAAQQNAQLIVLQELHNTPYFCQEENPENFDLAETIPGASTEHFGKLAKELGLVIVASLFEKRAAGLYHNTAVVLDSDGTLAGCYRKMHIPDDPGFYEKFYFTPGDLGFKPINTSLGTLGVLICWDQWFPEASRLMALSGAQLLIYPTAIGWDRNDPADEQQRQREAWITIQRSHAIANALPTIVCNRCGFESGSADGIQFWGSSFVCGPQGEILAQASIDQNDILLTNIDLDRSEQVRRIWPFLRDRRIDTYHDITKRYRDT